MGLTLIDWLSPSTHAEFNRNLYSSIRCNYHLYVYHSDLSSSNSKCFVQHRSASRVLHAYKVLRICWKHRKDKILFITYDDLYVWICQFFVKTILCFEHKTTPDAPILDKHAIWQRLLFYRIVRLCQSKAQESMLIKMGQQSKWLGLPISYTEIQKKDLSARSFLIVSELTNVDLASVLRDILYGTIKIKKNVRNIERLALNGDSVIKLVDRFDFPEDLLSAEAFVLLTDSSVRGSGWFSEAVKYGIPILLVTPQQQNVFEGTYPDYPYIKGDRVKNRCELKLEVARVREFNSSAYASSYMDGFNHRLTTLLCADD